MRRAIGWPLRGSMEQLVTRLCGALGRRASPGEIAALSSYCEIVRTWNARMDLTAARDDEALVEVMCGDAAVLAREDIVPAGARIVDVGSGAGAPVLPLLILRGDVTATLVEPLRKRVAFLRTVIGTLLLHERATVVEAKLIRGTVVPGAPFDCAMSRATLAPAAWLSVARGLAPRVLVLTAKESPPAAPAGWSAVGTEYRLPSGVSRRVTVYGDL